MFWKRRIFNSAFSSATFLIPTTSVSTRAHTVSCRFFFFILIIIISITISIFRSFFVWFFVISRFFWPLIIIRFLPSIFFRLSFLTWIIFLCRWWINLLWSRSRWTRPWPIVRSWWSWYTRTRNALSHISSWVSISWSWELLFTTSILNYVLWIWLWIWWQRNVISFLAIFCLLNCFLFLCLQSIWHWLIHFSHVFFIGWLILFTHFDIFY